MSSIEANMVLSWKKRSSFSAQLRRMFCEKGSVSMSLFYFEIVIAKKRDKSELSLDLLVHLHGSAVKIFFQRFTLDRMLMGKVIVYRNMKKHS